MADFQAYRIFRALARHSHLKGPSRHYESDEQLTLGVIGEEEVIDDLGLYGFFQSYYDNASGEEEVSSILTKPITEEESKFLIRLMDKKSQGFITYEE